MRSTSECAEVGATGGRRSRHRRNLLQEDENGCLQDAYRAHTAFIRAAYYLKIKASLPSGKHHFNQTPKNGRIKDLEVTEGRGSPDGGGEA